MTTEKPKPDRRSRRVMLDCLAHTEQRLHDTENLRARVVVERNAIEADNKALEAKIEASRADFAEIKQRLLAAELESARMRGYLDRVHEDDVVREELLTIGAPDGEQRMVPKRKHAKFETPDQTSRENTAGLSANERIYRERTNKRCCWVSY